MNNNLKKFAKNLRSYAKRCKKIKYNNALLLTYLITGLLPLDTHASVTNRNIEQQKQNINNSIEDIKDIFKKAKAENNKLLKGINLELIQLMEQGDHVVKSPWSSWQFGVNYYSDTWNGTHKGRGDKSEKYPYEGTYWRSTDSFERYTSPLSTNYDKIPISTDYYAATSTSRTGLGTNYGLISTKQAQEPLVILNVESSIRPKTVNIEIPDLGIKVPLLNTLAVPNLFSPSLEIPVPIAVIIPNKTPIVNANPVSEYAFNSHNVKQGISAYSSDPQNGLNKIYWSGWNPNTGTTDFTQSVYQYDANNNLITSNSRISNVFYMNSSQQPAGTKYWHLKDATVHVAECYS